MALRLFPSTSEVETPQSISSFSASGLPINAATPPFERTQVLSGASFGTAYLIIIAILLLFAIGGSVPPWLNASVIGLAWGALFVLGLALTWAIERRVAAALLALVALWLGTQALARLTDLDYDLCRLLSLLQLTGGWLSGLAANQLHRCERARFSIWDLALLSSFVAAACWSAQNYEQPLGLLLQVGPAAVGGLLCSLLVCEWGLRDHWSALRFIALPCGVGAAALLIQLGSPGNLSLYEITLWLLAGPISVVAAQATTTLALLGLCRFDAFCQLAKTQATASPCV